MSEVPYEVTEERSFADTVRLYLDITRPRVMALVVFTGFPALMLGRSEWPDLATSIVVFPHLTADSFTVLPASNNCVPASNAWRFLPVAWAPLQNGLACTEALELTTFTGPSSTPSSSGTDT